LTNERKYKITIEKEIEVTLDLDKYSSDILDQIKGYWGYDEDMTPNEVLKEAAEDLALQFSRDGYLDKNIEGFPCGAQICKDIDMSIETEEL
jgi:hypothetical protein